MTQNDYPAHKKLVSYRQRWLRKEITNQYPRIDVGDVANLVDEFDRMQAQLSAYELALREIQDYLFLNETHSALSVKNTIERTLARFNVSKESDHD